jgi:hypothetical protein
MGYVTRTTFAGTRPAEASAAALAIADGHHVANDGFLINFLAHFPYVELNTNTTGGVGI